jgi:hypothetical protein
LSALLGVQILSRPQLFGGPQAGFGSFPQGGSLVRKGG